MTNLDNLFELHEIVKVFLKEPKSSNNLFQIDFGVSYRPSKNEEVVFETVSVFLTYSKSSKNSLIVQIDENRTCYINNISQNKELGLQTLVSHEMGTKRSLYEGYKRGLEICDVIIDYGVENGFVSIRNSLRCHIDSMEGVGFVELEPTLKEVA